MIAQLLALTLLGTTSAGINPGTVEVSTNFKDGDVISGEVQFKVTVKSDSPVTQVEFYVGDDLRSTDESTPYEFKLDTLNETEGDIKITFGAYTTSGDSAKKVFKFKIDNELSKGVDYHVAKAMAFVSLSKFDEAIQAARIALKAKPDSNPARIAMARAKLGNGVLDDAQRYATDVLKSDPNNVDAHDLISGINLRRAFSTVNRGGDRNETLKTIGDAMKEAVENREKTLLAQLDKLTPVTPENLTKYTDLCMACGRYTLAINQLAPVFRKNEKNTAVANRLIYAYLRNSQNHQAGEVISAYEKRGKVDAYGYALIGIYRMLNYENEASQTAIKEAALDDGQNVGVKTAQAYIALRGRKLATLDSLAKDLIATEGQLPEVNFYMASVNQMLGKFTEAEDRYQQAVLAEPTCFDIYIQKGIDALNVVFKKKADPKYDAKDAAYQYQSAQVFFETALKAKPDSPEALSGLALTFGLQKKQAQFVDYAKQATKAGPTYAAGQYVLAAALVFDETSERNIAMKAERDGNRDEAKKHYTIADRINEEARNALKQSNQLDPTYLVNFPSLPKTEDAYLYFIRYGKIVLLPKTAE